MALSNTATPKYYGQFRDAVINGEIPICKEIEMEMHRIDDLIANPGIYYDDKAIDGFIKYCENELTLTDGGDLKLLDSFKLWAEQIFGWYYFVERSVYVPSEDGRAGHYLRRNGLGWDCVAWPAFDYRKNGLAAYADYGGRWPVSLLDGLPDATRCTEKRGCICAYTTG